MSRPRPGWYPDPSPEAASRAFRWWDGSSWTAELSDSATAPPPADPHRVGSVAAPAKSRRPQLVALLLGLSLVVSSCVVGLIGWSGWQDQRRAGLGSGNAPGASASEPRSATAGNRADRRKGSEQQSSGPNGRLDEVTREAVIADAQLVLPGHPYELVSDPITVPGVFDAMFLAGAPVHSEYNGTDDWNATVGIGHVPADAWQGQDPKVFAERALAGITAEFFGNHATTVKKVRHGATLVDGHPCAEVSAQVHYQIKNVPSRYDKVKLIGCPTDDGSVITAISSVPDDADPELVRLAEESLSTLELG